MNSPRFATQSRLDKKLCIHCRHFETSLGTSLCGYYRDNVSDSPKYTAHEARDNPLLCNGRKWEVFPGTRVCQSDEEVAFLIREHAIGEFMETAKNIVEGNIQSYFSCGYLDIAIERVRNQL